ncbi:hypothetical protein KF840_20460 [bacterium]|nr:hypothetical protein [bacterium]
MRVLSFGGRLAVAMVLLAPWPALAQGSFVNFESGHVRPLALSPDGNRLFAVNTPDNRLEIYDVDAGGLTLAAEVAVGLEPVAVASRVNAGGRVEAWVVNHLSDSVSIVEVDPGDVTRSRVTRTLLVGDEPRDIVFAGAGFNRAFVTTARRGQNLPGTVPANLTTAGTARALVWAFDANAPGAALGGTPLSVIQCLSDTPRALAVSPDGTRVYAAAFQSGNRTTALSEGVVTNNGGLPPPPPGATANPPDTGLIVKFNPANSRWEDEISRDWTARVPFTLPDRDVFIINATANPPALLASNNTVVGVGTILFNMAVRPDNGKIYVSNLESRNHVRFEPLAAGGVQGHIAESRITIINGTTPTARHLNPHVDYAVATGSQAERDQSLAFPTDMVFAPNGLTLFVAAFGSGKVAAIDTNALEAGTVSEQQVAVGNGPSGVVLDAARDRLYVMNRIDHTISVVSDASNAARAQTAVVPLRFDPSPPAAKLGRRFLYDAHDTSGHGDSACASCHIFGDFDSLAWDLGDPFGAIVANPNPFRIGSGGPFHPMKGPMTTQSLRGMADAGPMHWRGDRTGGTNGGDPLNEDLAFKEFNPAFVGLLGRDSELTASEMQEFTDFILSVRYPPNPVRALTDVATVAESAGASFFTDQVVDAGVLTCALCHALPFGTDGFSSFEGEPQEFKIAHLRNAYQKVGMFGSAGNQVRGFGFLHDGSVPTVFNFLQAGVFTFGSNANTKRRNLEAFILAFDTGLKPAVGQQVSVTPSSVADSTVIARIDLLIGRDDAGDCDLVVKGVSGGEARGWVYAGGNSFRSDRVSEPLIDKTALRALAGSAGQEQVYTCVPPGSGQRIGIDRDLDNRFDRDELDAGSDPADPLSLPEGTATPTFTPTAVPPTATMTFTRTATGTPTGTATATITSTPASTATGTPTALAPTATPTTVAPTATPTPTVGPQLVCSGGVALANVKLKIARNALPAGDEKLFLKGELRLPSLLPAIDPSVNGFSLQVRDRGTGQPLLTRFVPPGASTPGWARGGSAWKFSDRDGGLAGGVSKVMLKDRSSRTPGLFQFTVRGKGNDFRVASENLELVVVLGSQPQGAAGQCGSATFNPGGAPAPACAALGSTLRCD